MNTQTSLPLRSRRTSLSTGQELRTVGQGLASLNVADFDVRRERDGYFALAIPGTAAAGDTNATVRNTWWNLTRRRATDRLLAEAGPGVLRVLFTPEGMLRLEAAGIAKRDLRTHRAPDPTGLGQMLRVIGERLDHQAARFLSVSKRGSWITCEYASDADERMTEEWKVSDLRGFWQNASQQRYSVNFQSAPLLKASRGLFR